MLKFVPTQNPDGVLPALFVGPQRTPDGRTEFVFQGIDTDEEVQFESFHPTLADALKSLARRMESEDRYAGRQIEYSVETGK